MEKLTKKTQNKWGSEVSKFFYTLYEEYMRLPMGSGKIPSKEYQVMAWNCAWIASQMLYEIRRENRIKKTAPLGIV